MDGTLKMAPFSIDKAGTSRTRFVDNLPSVLYQLQPLVRPLQARVQFQDCFQTTVLFVQVVRIGAKPGPGADKQLARARQPAGDDARWEGTEAVNHRESSFFLLI